MLQSVSEFLTWILIEGYEAVGRSCRRDVADALKAACGSEPALGAFCRRGWMDSGSFRISFGIRLGCPPELVVIGLSRRQRHAGNWEQAAHR